MLPERRGKAKGKQISRKEKEETNVKGRDNSRKYKKIRRGRTRNKKIRDDLDIYYFNIRGIKSKMESLESILDERKPDIVGIVETMLDKQEEIKLKEYKVIRNDRNREGGGVMLAVKREFEHVTVEVSRTAVFEQSIWILIGSKDKVRIDLIYAPQESRTSKKQIKDMYDRIKGEINTSKVNKEKIIIMGDSTVKLEQK